MRAQRRRALTEQDRATWALYVRSVAPLAGVPVPEAPPEPAQALQQPGQTVPSVPMPAVQRLSPVLIGHHPPGVDKATWNRFRTGKLGASRTLDLHGRTAQRAFFALQDFLGSAHAERLRCVEVITGRGSGEAGGVIRREFPMWLNQPELRSLVLAAAHPHAANPGSVRLLLRRVRTGK
jgi:DNA-nicking Smr family endonuclease